MFHAARTRHLKLDLHSLELAPIVLGLVLSAATGCSSEDGGDDAGATDTGAMMDAGVLDATLLPDAGERDSGPRDATPPNDAGHYCTVSNAVAVGAAQVAVGTASQPGTVGTGSRADTACIDRPPSPGTFNDPIFIRGCLNVVDAPGGSTAQAELDQIDVDIFFARMGGSTVDPSFDRTTNLDRDPAARIPVSFTLDTSVDRTTCSSSVQLQIGFNANPTIALKSETEYIIRARTSTSGTAGTWATTYYYGIIVRNDNISRVGGGDCNSSNCFNRHNFTLLRGSALSQLTAQLPTAVPGSSVLTDGLGSGYAAIETFDCNGLPIRYAVAGLSPAPQSSGYLQNGMLSSTLSDTSSDGVYFAGGFPGQTSTSSAAVQASAAIGVDRDGTCTEEFGGARISIFPDAISIIRSSRETALHRR